MQRSFSISENNQKSIHATCVLLEKKLEEIAERTTKLEGDVKSLMVQSKQHSRDISEIAKRQNLLEESAERLENHSRRNNIRILNVPEAKEGMDIKLPY